MGAIEGSTSDLIGNVLGQLGGGEPPLVRGEAGGGAVRVTLRGLQHVESVTIAVEALDDATLLGDMVAAAVNDALEKARSATQQTALGLLQQLTRE